VRLRSTNSVEQDRAEIRRRTGVVRICPNDPSLVRLASALAIKRNNQWIERAVQHAGSAAGGSRAQEERLSFSGPEKKL
jgi:transposase-like protein